MAGIESSPSYHVDLAELMRVYETNYAKLCALIPPTLEVGETKSFKVETWVYSIEILEITKYTTLVNVSQCEQVPIFPLPRMTVRLYHDAKVAEVSSSERISRIAARYEYPNKQMMQKDEKLQINQFLGEWLRFCLRHGISLNLGNE
jgi:uncharacterized protein YqiB (DUF1249 family)